MKRRLYRLTPVALATGTLIALLGALIVRGEASLAFLAVFVVLLPATLAATLIRWWPRGREPGESAAGFNWRRKLLLSGGGLLLAAVLTLLLGVAWSGGRLGNMLLVAGVLLLPPAALVAMVGWLVGRDSRLAEELTGDTDIRYRAREHWGVFVAPISVLTLAALLALGPFGAIGYSAAGVLYLLALPGLAMRALGAYLNTELAVTDTEVVVVQGLVRRRVLRMPLDTIDACGVAYGTLGRWLGWGRVDLVGADGRSISVRGVADPDALRRALDRPAH